MEQLEKKYQEEYTKLRTGNFSERKEIAGKLKWLKENKHKKFTPPNLSKEIDETIERCRILYREIQLLSSYMLP